MLQPAQAPSALLGETMEPISEINARPPPPRARQPNAPPRRGPPKRPPVGKCPEPVASDTESEHERDHCHSWVVAKKWCAVREEMSTDSAHLCDVRKGRLVYTTSRRASESGSVRLRMVAPIEGWVSEKVLEPFRYAKRWRTTQHCLDCRNVIEVRDAGKKGMAVYTKRAIPKHTFIGEYVGDLIDEKEYDARYPKGDGTHVYWIREGDVYLDAGPSKHFTRYINHSKKAPNLETKVEFVKVVDREEVLCKDLRPNVGFYTTKDVPKGDELTFDYGGDYFQEGEAPTEDTIFPPEYRDAVQSGRMTEQDVIIDRTVRVFEKNEASKAAQAAAWADQKRREEKRGDTPLNAKMREREHAKITEAFKPEVEHFPISKSQRERESRLGLVPYDRRPQKPYVRLVDGKPYRHGINR